MSNYFERFCMSFPSKTGFAGKAGKTLLGVALLGSLALTACSSPASSTQPTSEPVSSAAPTAMATPSIQGIEFNSDSFDSSKQASFSVNRNDNDLVLSDGVVSFEAGDGGKIALSYIPYKTQKEAWKYKSDEVLTDSKANLMRWKDKSYIVLHGMSGTVETANGLSSEKTTTTEIVIVLDLESGAAVNTLKGDTTSTTGGLNQSGLDTLYLINDETIPDVKTGTATVPSGLYDTEPFMVGLVYGTKNGQTVKLVDPLTGKEIATDTKKNQHYNEAGFWKASETYSAKSFGYDGGNIEAVFGNYMLVSNEKRATSGNYTEYRLVNTVTKEVSPPSACVSQAKDAGIGMRFSPDFRYVNFYGKNVFDTKTGASYCTQPANHPEIRPFVASLVDNEGNMYGTADKDYLKVNIADTSKTQKWSDGASYNEVPVSVTTENSLVLKRNDGETQTFFVLPEKK